MMGLEFSLILLLFLIFCSAFFSASETALFSLSSTKIKAYRDSADPRKKLISSLISKPKDLLVTIFMLNTLVNILMQNTVSHMFGQAASWIYKVGLPFVLMLFAGEIIPKYFGLLKNAKISYYVTYPISIMQNLIKPIRILTIKVAAPVSRVLFFYLKPEEDISKEELKHVLKTSEEYGVLQHDEAELVGGYLNLQDATVKEIMRPRNDILYFDLNESLSKLTYLFMDQECSRLPVCDKSIENVLGIMTAKQFFLHRHQITSGKELTAYLSKPLFVPESIPARHLLRRLDESKQILAIVVDEYGSISGVVSREDLVELVIGEITDLRDAKSLFVKAGQYEIIANGNLELSEFNEIFHTDLTNPHNMVTIGGWLIDRAGEIPKSGAKYEFEHFIFQVLAADPNKIRRLYIRKRTSDGLKKTNG